MRCNVWAQINKRFRERHSLSPPVRPAPSPGLGRLPEPHRLFWPKPPSSLTLPERPHTPASGPAARAAALQPDGPGLLAASGQLPPRELGCPQALRHLGAGWAGGPLTRHCCPTEKRQQTKDVRALSATISALLHFRRWQEGKQGNVRRKMRSYHQVCVSLEHTLICSHACVLATWSFHPSSSLSAINKVVNGSQYLPRAINSWKGQDPC